MMKASKFYRGLIPKCHHRLRFICKTFFFLFQSLTSFSNGIHLDQVTLRWRHFAPHQETSALFAWDEIYLQTSVNLKIPQDLSNFYWHSSAKQCQWFTNTYWLFFPKWQQITLNDDNPFIHWCCLQNLSMGKVCSRVLWQ